MARSSLLANDAAISLALGGLVDQRDYIVSPAMARLEVFLTTPLWAGPGHDAFHEL